MSWRRVEVFIKASGLCFTSIYEPKVTIVSNRIRIEGKGPEWSPERRCVDFDTDDCFLIYSEGDV